MECISRRNNQKVATTTAKTCNGSAQALKSSLANPANLNKNQDAQQIGISLAAASYGVEARCPDSQQKGDPNTRCCEAFPWPRQGVKSPIEAMGPNSGDCNSAINGKGTSNFIGIASAGSSGAIGVLAQLQLWQKVCSKMKASCTTAQLSDNSRSQNLVRQGDLQKKRMTLLLGRNFLSCQREV
eukprot:CAMPEP_0206630612 /NCGR_PEP_ID=MMETSP0325_2-20121206/67680_1 /ASSEMBLY_ACC=CAM_ASM_000347 /TAXON_ID=2866 /ORGANISM="Crypthecodinium cohnii, Strain Seligo" /LENGTH=183 /DNA_ID=CAMNT_0054155511 /DNA_START=65 /DNA_END=618 /DNA_ORIENTATION=+